VPTITIDDLKPTRTGCWRAQSESRRRRRHRRRETQAAARPRVRRAAGEAGADADRAVAPQGLGRRIVVKLDVPQAVVDVRRPRHRPQGSRFHDRLYRQPHSRRRLVFLAALSGGARKARLAYSVSDSLVWLDHALFLGGTATRADRTGETLDLIEKEIHRLAESGPTADELAKAKAYLNSSFALNLDTSSKIAGCWCNCSSTISASITFSGGRQMIGAVTLDDARRVAKRLLDGGLLVTVWSASPRASPRPPRTERRPVIPVTATIAIDEREITEDFVRSSGPGGQNVNKLSTAVQLRFDVRHSPSLPRHTRAARTSRRLAADARRRHCDHGAAPSHPGPQPGRRARPAARPYPSGRDRADQTATDQADQGVPRAPHRRQETPFGHQEAAPRQAVG
jgi:hypothetical protein